jgi:hypothetical protein
LFLFGFDAGGFRCLGFLDGLFVLFLYLLLHISDDAGVVARGFEVGELLADAVFVNPWNVLEELRY